MKIIPNIPQGVKLIDALKYFRRQKKDIYECREKNDFEKEREYILNATSDWGKNVCRSLGIEIEAEGLENLPEKGPVVYVSNHQSYADIGVACAMLDKFQFGFIAKNSLEKIPMYGKAIMDIRSIMIEREDPRESLKAIKAGVELIENGFSLYIFPEGTRSRCHEMAEFKKGSLKLATKPGVPVVPITIDGTYKVFEEKGVISPARVRFIVHPPIETAGMERKEANNLAETVEAIVRSKL